MMNAAIVDVMNSTGHTLPEAHSDDLLMAALANDVRDQTGFENIGIPFCMTVEAEVLGSEIDIGTLGCEPKIRREAYPSAESVETREIGSLLDSGRVKTVAGAAHRLSSEHPDLPVIGNLTGAISTSASLVDPISFLKGLRKDRDNSHRVLEYVSDFLTAYARLLVENGADVISIGDPTATGEILGPKMFNEYALPYLNRIVDGIHSAGARVIVHICGDIGSVKHLVTEIRSDAISTDAMVNLHSLKGEYPWITTMGNVSTYLLQFGTPEKIARKTESLIEQGIDIIAPACGLSTSTSLENIRALTSTVTGG
jgi:[methyl-Co(III) methanol-specific corrinoid protein]:coenzyme M methyltransferase